MKAFTFRVLFLILQQTLPALSDTFPSVNNVMSEDIIHGYKAKRGQFPHQVALSLNNYFMCSGSLISDSWILTAAHCLSGAENKVFSAVLGTENVNFTGDGSLTMNVSVIIPHEEFHIRTAQNDIGLLKLPSPINFTSYIRPVKLPNDPYTTYEGDNVEISGWGYLSDSAATLSSELYYVNVTVISNDECGTSYDYDYNPVTDSVICCSGSNGAGPCRDDSGGALVISNNDGTFTQIGVMSFGSKYCEDEKPSAYTRVSSYLDWIQEISGVTAQPDHL